VNQSDAEFNTEAQQTNRKAKRNKKVGGIEFKLGKQDIEVLQLSD